MERGVYLDPVERRLLLERHQAAIAHLDDFHAHERWKALALVVAPPPWVVARQHEELDRAA